MVGKTRWVGGWRDARATVPGGELRVRFASEGAWSAFVDGKKVGTAEARAKAMALAKRLAPKPGVCPTCGHAL